MYKNAQLVIYRSPRIIHPRQTALSHQAILQTRTAMMFAVESNIIVPKGSFLRGG